MKTAMVGTAEDDDAIREATGNGVQPCSGSGRTKDAGFVITVELLLVTVLLGVGLLTGLTQLRDQTLAQLDATGQAIGSISPDATGGAQAHTAITANVVFQAADASAVFGDGSSAGTIGVTIDGSD